MKTLKRAFGDTGENIAKNHLLAKGFRIVESNYQKPWGEIDIVAEKQGVLHFCEVKTRDSKHTENYLPEYSVNRKKIHNLKKICATYLAEKKSDLKKQWQIDVITISLDKIQSKTYIHHMENVIWEKQY